MKSETFPKIKIRDLEESDFEVILALENKLFSDPWTKSEFEDMFEDDEWNGFVAVSNNAIIGYAVVLAVDNKAHLANLAVEPAFQRKLVAQKLLGAILEDVERKKCEFILLEVRLSNKPAISFYEKNSFKRLFSRPNYYRLPLEDALVMVRYFVEGDK